MTDGKHVWVVTGNGVVTAFDMDGKEIWKRNLQNDYGKFGLNWGYALVADSARRQADRRSAARQQHGRSLLHRRVRRRNGQAEVASRAADRRPRRIARRVHDARGGRTSTASRRSSSAAATMSPATIRRPAKSSGALAGLNPRQERNYRIVGSPVVVGEMIYAPTRKTPLLALRAGGKGDVTDSNLAWKWTDAAAPMCPRP